MDVAILYIKFSYTLLPPTAAPPNLAPTFTASPQDVLAIRTDTVTFICTVIAVPTANITWERDNSSLSSGGRYNISTISGVMVGNLFQTSSTLTISDVQEENQGAYRCTASSNDRTVMATGILTVQGELGCA